MNKIWISIAGWLFGATIACSAFGQAQSPDVGLVNQVAGAATYSNAGSASKAVQVYMRVRQGDRIVLPQGALLQISYFTAGVKETWKGAATFVVTSAGGEVLKGAKPDIAKLPGSVADKLARVPGLIAGTRAGGVTVRGVSERPSPEKKRQEVAKAMADYETMRAGTERSDITPELFLFSVLQEYEMYDDLKVVAQDLLRRAPDNRDIVELANWAIKRAEQR